MKKPSFVTFWTLASTLGVAAALPAQGAVRVAPTPKPKAKAEAAENLQKGQEFLAENGQRPEVKTTESGLQYEVLQAGKGTSPGATDRVTVNYRGTLLDGTEFDSSYKRGEPAQFGVDQVIAGWTEGLQLMRTGSRYKFYIPAELAYGKSRGPGGSLPLNSTLVFEVELLGVTPSN